MGAHKIKSEYIIDASVLIDYCINCLSVLTLFSKEIRSIYIPTPIIYEEVSQLTTSKAKKNYLKLIEPEIEQALEAEAMKIQTSFYDNICFILARDNGYTCITNDKHLKQLCKKRNVPNIWGLEILVILANKSKISNRKPVNIASAIRKSNSFITNEIIERFKNKIR